jgi:tRNA pseudouridine38-40 synthase
MERNLKLLLAYDGTDFHGWQRQAGVRTVQEDVETVLRRVLGHPLHLHGASRTDAGVHARGQVASVLTSSPIPIENLRRAIGCRLPPDVALLHAAVVPREFQASAAALGKLYRYRIFSAAGRPVETLAARYTWHVWYPLDLDRMRAAAAMLVGTHDFAAFASQGSPRYSTVRTVRRIGVRRCVDVVQLDVEGDGFLYNQVRNMVGTLVEIGRGHWPAEHAAEILASHDRRRAGPTAPPQGLCLQWVRYAAVRSVTDGPG